MKTGASRRTATKARHAAALRLDGATRLMDAVTEARRIFRALPKNTVGGADFQIINYLLGQLAEHTTKAHGDFIDVHDKLPNQDA